MILSAQQLVSDDQAITATAASTDYLDLQATGTPYGAAAALVRDIGKGTPVCFDAIVTEAFNNLTSLTIALQVDDNSSFSSATTVASQTIALASLTVGANFAFEYLPEGVNERYFRLNYTVSGTAPTTGQITAGITGGRQTNQ